ncbi:unnamed protein product [Paramecium primaurelia]|uniref:Uncharacterized protein n=1 Tax=Paramecium primaurelia TaxID=5886 RepID=A0A8S1LFZ7_PARPR|nr:unnamed protein product [Paramecium primaurelia]
MNRVISFGFATFESLVQKLSSVENATSLFKVYQENKDQFKHEHVVISLRVLGRFSRQINSDNNFSEITSKLNDIVGQLTEYDVVDVLFWLRKFRLNRIPTNITNQTQNQLFQRIQQMSDNQMFSFRNMCSIYYDLSILNQYSETLVKSISEQMLTSKQLSPFLINQLLSTVVIKINHCNLSKYDQAVLTNSIKALDGLLDSFDIEQKSQLFKVCAEVQFQNLPPKFQLPVQIKKIKDSLQDKIELLQEESVINIFKAYEYLPSKFEIDLLKQLREMIMTTLEQNPQNLSDKFIIQISERMIKMTTQKISQDVIKKVLMELCNRIQNKTIDIALLNQLIPTLMKYKKMDEILQALLKLEDKSIKVLNYLFINGVNMKEYVEKFIQNKESKRIPLNQAINYAVYANRDAKEHLDIFVKVCREQIENYPLQALKTFNENELNFQIKYQLQEEAYLKLLELVKQQKFDFLRVFRELINCCCNNKSRTALLQFYDQQQNKVNPKQMMQRLVQDIDPFDSESFSSLLQLLSRDPKNIPIQRFVDYMTLNSHKFLDLIKSDQLQWAIKILVSAYQAQPEQKLYPIVNFAFRFENIGYLSRHVSAALKKISEQFKQKNLNQPFPDPLFVNLLMNHNLLTPEEAVIQLNNDKTHWHTKVQLCGIALQAENIPQNIIELRDKIKESCFKALEQEVKYQPILELITLGDFTNEEFINIKTKLQTIQPQLQAKQYFDLIMSAKDYSILKELSTSFSELSSKLGFNRIMRAVEKFAKFQIQSQMVYNVLLETYGYSFYFIFNEQRIQILDIFAQAKIKQADLFKRTLEKIKQQSSAYKSYYYEIIEICTSLGFVEQEFVDLINQIVEKTQISGSTALKLLQYYVLADQPIEVIDKVADSIVDAKYKDNFKTALTYEILLRKYPNSKAVKVHEAYLNEEKISKARYQIANSSNKQHFPNEFCTQYFNLLGVEFETNKNIDGINVEFYLPSIETSLLIVSQATLNFDQTTLNGFGLLQKKLLESITKQVIVINFKQLLQIQTHEDRATYLMNLGIPIKVDVTQVDYSSLKVYDKNDKEKPTFQQSKSNQRKQFGKQDYLQDHLQIDKE